MIKKKKSSTLFPHAWYKSLSKIPREAAADIFLALQKLDITGEMTVFEEGSIQDVLFSQFSETILSYREAYEEECKNRSEAAKAREAKKAQETTKKHEGAQAVTDKNRCDVSGCDVSGKEKKRKDVSGGGGDVSGKDAGAPAAHNSATTTNHHEKDFEIVEIWNAQELTSEIRSIQTPATRRERTEMAIAVAGGMDPFIDLIKTVGEQAYFRRRQREGYTVDYDWLIRPENFQAFAEGKYKNEREAEGYEYV